MSLIKRWVGDFYMTRYESADPREKGDPNACYLEIAGGELIWHADEYCLIYCAPYAPNGPKYREGHYAAFHERVVFLAVSAVLMLTFGVWTAARALVLRAMMERWDGRQPGHYTRSTPVERDPDEPEREGIDDLDGLEEEEGAGLRAA